MSLHNWSCPVKLSPWAMTESPLLHKHEYIYLLENYIPSYKYYCLILRSSWAKLLDCLLPSILFNFFSRCGRMESSVVSFYIYIYIYIYSWFHHLGLRKRFQIIAAFHFSKAIHHMNKSGVIQEKVKKESCQPVNFGVWMKMRSRHFLLVPLHIEEDPMHLVQNR